MPSPPPFSIRRAGVLLLLLLAGCGSGRETPNVLLVSIDSLRADHLGCYGYGRDTSPFLDELAAEGVRFTNAVSTTSWTLPAHAAMFTGLHDSVHGVVDNGLALAPDQVTLAEILRQQGYHTAGFYGGPYLHPTFGLGQGFDVYESCMSFTPETGEGVRRTAMSRRAPAHSDVTGPRTREKVRAWADTRPAGQPWFCFVHLWDVHYDFIPPPEYARRFDPDYQGTIDGRLMSNPAIARDMNPRDLEHVVALYDGEIRFTDHVLRGIFEDLDQRGMLDGTLVVVTADHGEEFFEHGQKGHNKTLFDEVVRVPLIVVWPGTLEAGRVVEDQVQLIDILPTVAFAAGVRESLAVQGRDLGPLLAGRPQPPRSALLELMIDRGSQRAVRTNDWKILHPRDGAPTLWFDLRADPGEQRPWGIEEPAHRAEHEAARAELAASVRRSAEMKQVLARRPPDAIELPSGMAEELRKLGYLGEQNP